MSQPKEQTNSRRNYYIDKDFQNKFVMKFCGLVALGAVVTMALLYLMAREATTVSIVHSRITVRTPADFLLPLMVQTVIIVTVIVSLAAAAVTLFVSHKIAGPLFRFKQTFRELSLGNFSNQVRLRKGDQLLELASEFNHMIASVRGQILISRSNIESAKADLDAISEFNVEDSKRHQFMALKKKLQDASQAIHFFRT
jgi:methyl-accepting chemotaxis protein